MAREDGFFDDLARGLADGSLTRGKALRLMGAAVVGGTLGSLGIGGEASADPPGCKRNGKICARNEQCCSGNCSGGSCRAQTTTTTTTTPLCRPNGVSCPSVTQCCSGNCSHARCCPTGRVGLSNGTCALPCSSNEQCSGCGSTPFCGEHIGGIGGGEPQGICTDVTVFGHTCSQDIDCSEPGQ